MENTHSLNSFANPIFENEIFSLSGFGSRSLRVVKFPASSVPALLIAMKGGTATVVRGQGIPGADASIMAAAWNASYWSYARAYRLGWWSVVPFVALATASVACMRGVKELMTEKVEATVERESDDEVIKKGQA